MCVPECPVNAIYAEEDVPAHLRAFVDINAELAKKWLPITKQKDPLPDHKNSKTKIDTNNNKIIIGIIGAISEIKGKIFIENLINYYKHNSLVQIIIFGILHNYEYAYMYNNINELNYLFIKHKPNILLETSLSPETYSYTLTIKKLTQ